MSRKESPLLDTRRFKRDAVLSLMKDKGWIPRMESTWELNFCIHLAEEDLKEDRVKIDNLEEYVYHIDWIFCCEWDSSINEWFKEGEDE